MLIATLLSISVALACRLFKMQATLEATMQATMVGIEPVEETQLRLRRVGATMPVYAKQWRTLPVAGIMDFCVDVVSSVQLLDTLPADKRQDCAIVNVLIDTWRERGSELTPDGRPVAGTLPYDRQSFHSDPLSFQHMIFL
jgi:hypothetical protein